MRSCYTVLLATRERVFKKGSSFFFFLLLLLGIRYCFAVRFSVYVCFALILYELGPCKMDDNAQRSGCDY
uniref:Putative secreted protein n=1 Tax=Anopheles darlingi TaxID=43151 RepID=A0A2M4DHN5_ANODA